MRVLNSRPLIFCLTLFLSFFSHAQIVEKVTGKEVVANLMSTDTLSVGDKVSFLDGDLQTIGNGTVLKVSNGGKKVLIKIDSGNAKVGMSLEKINSHSTSENTKVLYHNSKENNYYLTDEDSKILREGEISTPAYIIGGILGTWPLGLGVGHAIQGRYIDKGWIFTTGELASLGVFVMSAGSCIENKHCSNNSLIALSLWSYIGFRIWEVIDVWAAPLEINRRYHNLKQRVEPKSSLYPILIPHNNGSTLLGFNITF